MDRRLYPRKRRLKTKTCCFVLWLRNFRAKRSRTPCEAAAYLNAAIEEGDREVFLLALRNVAEANGGMGAVAAKANLSRESLYRMFSRRGNPEIKSLFMLLHSMGLRLAVEAEPHVCGAGGLPHNLPTWMPDPDPDRFC